MSEGREEKIRAIEQIKKGMETAFIDAGITSNLACKPQFVYNDYREGKKVFSAIEAELENCDEFFFSVAFVREGGIAPFLQVFQDLKRRGIRGRLLTTDYLFFTESRALERVYGLGNIEIRMFRTKGNGAGFHTKGYLYSRRRIQPFHYDGVK